MNHKLLNSRITICFLTTFMFVSAAGSLHAHPMGNFSISHYAGIRIDGNDVQVRYILDLAEIPTFQEIQKTGILPKQNDPSLIGYLANQAEILKRGLLLEVDGRPVPLEVMSEDVIFPTGAGGLPTMKMGFLYRAAVRGLQGAISHRLEYSDVNFQDRAGWKEIVVSGAAGVDVLRTSAPTIDQSKQLTNYPTDLLNSPPQQLEAQIDFVNGANRISADSESVNGRLAPATSPAVLPPVGGGTLMSGGTTMTEVPARQSMQTARLELQPNKQATPRNAFTELMNARQLNLSIIFLAALIAVGLGALHALEPGHGKTLVAAYLVGSQGTAMHAMILGLIVTTSHTAGVFLLGAITLYAQHYIVPEQLYPWLGVISGVTITLLGFYLLLQRYLGTEDIGAYALFHSHQHKETPSCDLPMVAVESDPAVKPSLETFSKKLSTQNPITYRQLLALGVTGGIIPCPAALVVLLSAVALHRVKFGLFLIVAFSLGLAAVLIGTGMLVVYAGRFVSRLHTGGPLLCRWVPMASAAAVAVLGLVIALRALVSAGVLQFRV
jgi:ABC-type nickel/cobalt efflux system permease component RcnA